ncbi:hypothetical protein [Muricoccus radiodurans]|uniref:hypothetical protein n=1 Tax=Muricoccus radiodurans TaxID=2231721 RepID=UPI003CF02FFA
MTSRRDNPSDPVAFVFEATEVGWIDFRIPSLTSRLIQATHLGDPFPDLLQWLESILDGAESARWAIGEEGQMTQLVFLRAAHAGIDHMEDRLLLLSTSFREDELASRPVEAMNLIRDVYGAFRAFAEGPVYSPDDWEWDEEKDDCYDGHRLRDLRSRKIEAALRRGPEPEQLELRVGWSWRRRP